MRQVARSILWVVLVVACVTAPQAAGSPQGGGTQVGTAPPADKDSISGTVVNAAGGKPEAGVWVIAETKLAVPFRKIVVTDDQGRFLVPDLPAASYDVWVVDGVPPAVYRDEAGVREPHPAATEPVGELGRGQTP